MRRKTAFLQNSSNIPLIKFKIKDKELVALIDTGSESTLFDQSILECDVKEERGKKMSLVGIHGEGNCYDFSLVSALFEFPSDKDVFITRVSGLVTDISVVSQHFKENGEDLSIVAILGSDFLKRTQAKVDYKKKEVTFDDLSGQQ